MSVTTIPLTPEQIDHALHKPEFAKALQQYLHLQTLAQSGSAVYDDPGFRKEYNSFYKLRRDPNWQQAFYQVLADTAAQQLPFRAVLTQLHTATGLYEAAFASKLFATLNPTAPVIDSGALSFLGIQLPSASEKNHYTRINGIDKIHQDLTARYADFLTTPIGKYLISAFRRIHPDAAAIPREKMLDMVLAQTKLPKPTTPQW